MVTTFEMVHDAIRLWRASETMAEASASLPRGAYTTLRTYGGDRIARLEQHLRRLTDSLPIQGGASFLDEARVRQAISRALRSTGHPESRLRLTFAPPRLFVSVEPFEPLPDSLYREGVWCVTVPVHRENPRAKDTGFIATAEGAYRSLPPGAHEGLLLGEDGAILEGLSSNFFAVREGVLHTEEGRALPGITRSLVLDLAVGVLPLSRQPIRVDQLREVGDCFITSVSRGILPVVGIDEVAIGAGRPGSVTRELMRRFEEMVEREAVSVG